MNPHNLFLKHGRAGRGMIVALVLVMMVVAPWRLAAQQNRQTAGSRFGIVEAFYRPDDARELGVGWERIIFDWAQFQPDGPDQFRTEAVPEDWLSAAQRDGREVIGLLKNTPRWASASGQLGAPPDGLDLPIDDPGNVWAAFVAQAVTIYGDRWNIRHWIIYNEPDIRPGELPWHEFDGEVEDYYRMVKVAYLAAKQADPGAVIHLAGMARWMDFAAGRTPYLQRFLEIAWSDPAAHRHGFFFDVATVHSYDSTPGLWYVLNETKTLLAQYGLHEKAIWVGETNARVTADPGAELPPGRYGVSLDQQADYLVQAAALSLAQGVERFSVYRLYDDHYRPGQTEPWGLVRGDGSRRPAFDAYRTVVELFSPTTYVQHFYTARTVLVVLEQPGRVVYVMWARTETPARFYIRAAEPEETATWISVVGERRAIKSQAVEGVEGAWWVLEAPGAIPDEGGTVQIDGSPLIMVAEGGLRPVWVEVAGARWHYY